jgi:hypothetical protein
VLHLLEGKAGKQLVDIGQGAVRIVVIVEKLYQNRLFVLDLFSSSNRLLVESSRFCGSGFLNVGAWHHPFWIIVVDLWTHTNRQLPIVVGLLVHGFLALHAVFRTRWREDERLEFLLRRFGIESSLFFANEFHDVDLFAVCSRIFDLYS